MIQETQTLAVWILLIFIQSYTITTNGRDDFFGFRKRDDGKTKRALTYDSFLQNPIVNFMMQTIAPNRIPNAPVDFLDNLKDKYPLPNGK